jgi:hypothetical protein
MLPEFSDISTLDWLVILLAAEQGFDGLVARDKKQLLTPESVAALALNRNLSFVTWKTSIEDPLTEWGQLMAYMPLVLRWIEEKGAHIFWLPNHAARRELARYLVDRLNGRESVMYEVAVRDIPARSLLSLQRYVTGEPGVVALGRSSSACSGTDRCRALEGATGAAFLVYYGEVSEDSDGPIEWCRPVPEGQAQEIAARFPKLTLRTEPAHQEAYVHLGTAMVTAAQWQLVSEALHAWGAEKKRTT